MAAVALVLVSHSRALADGLRELVAPMAPDVVVATAGGLPDGGLGTDLERVQAALVAALEAAAHAVVLCDLGSAVMTAEIALELLEDPDRGVVAAGPFVEGALAAAVAAQGGVAVDQVLGAVREMSRQDDDQPTGADRVTGAGPGSGDAPADEAHEARAVLRNPLGLHARPAAAVAAAAQAAAADGTTLQLGRVGGPLVEADGLLRVVRLGLRGGDEVRVAGRGPDAAAAVDRLAELLASGFGEARTDQPPSTAPSVPVEPEAGAQGGGRLQGRAGAPGTAVGPVLVLDDPAPDLEAIGSAGPDEERRAQAARDEAVRDLRSPSSHGTAADVLAMHAALLTDPDLEAAVTARLRRGEPAAKAWWDGALEVAADLAGSGDALLAERAADLRDVALRVLARLGVGVAPPGRTQVVGRVVVAEDLPPSWVPVLAERGATGLALAGLGPTAHAVVLARGLGLPGVTSLGPSLVPAARDLPADAAVVLDGTGGTLVLTPTDQQVAAATAKTRADSVSSAERRSAAQAAVSVRGRVVPVLANVASATESVLARREGADGIGLLRTELLLTDRPVLPSEDEQVDALVAVAQEQGARRMVVRTFDVGGDKPVPALDLDPVRHGFLGERGLRLSLARHDLLQVQLRAVLRAAAQLREHGTEVALMAPMVTVEDEVLALRAALAAARAGLEADGHEAGDLSGVGVMVEVPAAALAVAELAPHVDFVSVGTNDLVQYLMAAERTNAAVAHLYRPEHPAVWRTLALLVEEAHAGGCEVGVCGQMAADPATACRLVELGVDDLSVPPSDVGRVKAALRELAP